MSAPKYPLFAKGGNGQVRFDGQKVEISRNGLGGRLTVGRGTKVIPVSSITAVRFRPATLVVVGFVQFSVLGDSTVKGNLSSGNLKDDENTIMIHSTTQSLEMSVVVDAINDAISRKEVADLPRIEVFPEQTRTSSRLDDLRKLAEIRELGILTPEEFQREKNRILSASDVSVDVAGIGPALGESENVDQREGYVWILNLPKVKDFELFDEILGFPPFVEGIKKSKQDEVWKRRNELFSIEPLNQFRDADKKPSRLNRRLTFQDASKIIENLANIRVSAEFRPE